MSFCHTEQVPSFHYLFFATSFVRKCNLKVITSLTYTLKITVTNEMFTSYLCLTNYETKNTVNLVKLRIQVF